MEKIQKITRRRAHKEHEGREEHKEESGVSVRYLIVKLTYNLRTKTPDLPFVIFVPL